ncbi:MAG: FtsW/RodA/SpoVE family cell cycle protein [Erysipelotrichaceae bacterium]|nr:FtsW/RodA/SpoVE family cell cycle protein [Erysipelotrichaceae bacterium]
MSEEVKTERRRMYSSPWILGAVLFLTMFSTVMIASANISSAESVMSDVTSSVLKQAVFIVLGFIGYLVAFRIFSFKLVRNWIGAAMIVELGLLLATRMFRGAGGAYAWIVLPMGMTIQPSEFAKIMIILIICNFMCDIKNKKIKKAWTLVQMPVLAMIILTFIIVIYQHDFGSGFALLAIGSICFLIPENKLYRKWQRWLVVLMVFVVAVTILLMSKPVEEALTSEGIRNWLNSGGLIANIFSRVAYQFYRFISAGNPLWDRFGYSQELLNSLLGIARGNIRGVGLGNSIQKFGYLASADADYIFPVIVEELGLLGIACVFIPYTIIYVTLIKYAIKVKTEKEKVVLIGTLSYLFVHMFLNIGGVSALIPLTGVPLILISRGGTSLITVLTTLGICQNIIRKYNKKVSENEDYSGEA